MEHVSGFQTPVDARPQTRVLRASYGTTLCLLPAVSTIDGARGVAGRGNGTYGSHTGDIARFRPRRL